MVAAYVNEIRKLQPEGPYHLVGYCFGGVLAIGMAHQIRGRVRRALGNETYVEEAVRAVEEAHREAFRRYVPKVYPGGVTLFRPVRVGFGLHRDPTWGWGAWAATVDVHAIPSERPTLVEEPPVRVLAEQLGTCSLEAQSIGTG